MYGMHTNEEIERFVNLFISCDVSSLPKPTTKCTTTSTHIHVRKNNFVYRFHYPLPCMCETKKLEPLLTNGNYPFSRQYFHTQANKIFQSSKNLKENSDISFYEYLIFLILDESTNILNLRSKFTKPHIFLK